MIFPSFLNVNNWHVAPAAGSLSSVFVIPTNNIVNTKTTYDIIFRTVTTGKISEIDISFPAGFDISRSKLTEVSGIGSGSLSSSGQIIIYRVNSPVRVLAGTTIRLEVGNIVNTNVPGNGYEIAVTTKTSSTIIDGPTSSSTFTIKQIKTGDIANGAITSAQIANDTIGTANIADNTITSSKIANYSVTQSKVSFITFHSLSPGQDGWNPGPDGVTHFNVTGGDLNEISQSSVILINVENPDPVQNDYGYNGCEIVHKFEHGFYVSCNGAENNAPPPTTVRLDIAVLNPP